MLTASTYVSRLTLSTFDSASVMDKKGAYHHGNLRADLVAAAVGILRVSGDGGVTLRAAARAAGVSQTAPYRHFSDKGALLAAVAENGFAGLYARCKEVLSSAKGPRDCLHQLGRVYVQFALDEPAMFRLMFSAELGQLKPHHPELAAASRQVYETLQRAVEGILSEASVDGPDVDTSSVAAWSLVHGLALLLLDQSIGTAARDPNALIDRVTRLFASCLPR